MAELCMGLSYSEIAKIQNQKLKYMNKKLNNIMSMLFCLVLIAFVSGIGLHMAIQKVKSEPTTVYLQGYDRTVDINDLPLVPLEELK